MKYTTDTPSPDRYRCVGTSQTSGYVDMIVTVKHRRRKSTNEELRTDAESPSHKPRPSVGSTPDVPDEKLLPTKEQSKILARIWDDKEKSSEALKDYVLGEPYKPKIQHKKKLNMEED